MSLEKLGLSPLATIEELKLKYKELAREMHPDAGGSIEDFTHLNDLYNSALNQIRLRRCPKCGGTKRVVAERSGFLQLTKPCPDCQ